MSSTDSFQKRLADFSKEGFVGRDEQLSLFEKCLNTSDPPFLILAISGQGGVGKTTLLEQLRHRANNHKVLTALVNEDQSTIHATLAQCALQFALQFENKYVCVNFNERYRKYQELKAQVEADPTAPKGILDFALRSAALIGMRSLRRVPMAGEAVDVLLTPEAEKLVADQVSAMVTYVIQKFNNKDERVLLLETDQELTRHFLTDLDKFAQDRQIVLFFDTYEKTAIYLDTWLQDLLSGKFGEFSSRILFVIAGRYPLGQAWTRFGNAVKQIELDEFTEAEAREYLTRSGITDEGKIGQLLKLSDRLPVLLALLVSAPGDIAIEVSADAVQRFLQGASSEQRKAALAGSAPRFFNQDILAAILDSVEAADSAFEWLSQIHFVRSSIEGWFYHDVVRSLMLRYFHLRSIGQYTNIHNKLEKYYHQAQVDALNRPDLDSDYRSNETWRKFEIERLYHRVSPSPLPRLNEILIGFLIDIDHQEPSKLRSYVQVLAQISDETGELMLNTWANRLKQVVLFLEDNIHAAETAEALAAATCLCNLNGLEKQDQSRAYVLRGRIYGVKAENFQAAIADFTKAIELQPENSMNYKWRGHTYRRLDDYSAALADYTRAIELEPENGYNYLGRGWAYMWIKDYPAALADLEKFIEKFPEYFFMTYHWNGQVHFSAKDYLTAIADFTKAIELQPENSMNYQWRGHAHRRLKDYSAALADYTRAIELEPENGYNYLGRSRTHLKMGNYTAALVDLDKVIERLPEYLFMKHQWQGQHHFSAKNYSAAIANFTQAIELQPKNDMHYRLRGQAYRHLKDYPAALTDYTTAIELEPNGHNYLGRGRVHMNMGNHTAALTDLSEAIELIKDVYTYVWRGRVYLAMNDTTKARADFAQVEQMSSKEGRPAYIIAVGYSQLYQVAEACTWLRRAFKRDRALAKEACTDVEFEPICETAEFKEIIAQFEEPMTDDSIFKK